MKHMTRILLIGMIGCLIVMVVPVAALNEGTIAFCSERDGSTWEIYTMSPDGTNLVRLTTNTEYDYYPAWSPDGSRIAYMSDWMTGLEGDSQREIYVMAEGTEPVRLTNNTADDLFPSWSPDGSKIVFTSDRAVAGTYEIYTMNADGTNPVRLTTTDAREGAPAWSSGESITVKVPNGGETFYQGSTLPMNWSYTGNLGSTVDIAVLKGGSVVKVLPGIPIGAVGSGSYSVTIPPGTLPANDYKIRVTSTSSPAYTDISDGPFTILPAIQVTSPNGGENWTPGSSHTLTWTYTGNPGPAVKIEALWGSTVIGTIPSVPIGSAGSGSYSLTVPLKTPPGTEYRFRVTSTTYPGCSDTSNGAFTISAP